MEGMEAFLDSLWIMKFRTTCRGGRDLLRQVEQSKRVSPVNRKEE